MNTDDSIDKALQADRAAIPPDDPGARARLVAMLGTLPPAGITGGAPAGGILSAGFAKIVAIGAVALGVGSGIYFLPSYLDGDAEETSAGSAAPVAAPAVGPSGAPVESAVPEVPDVPKGFTPPDPRSRREGEPDDKREKEKEGEREDKRGQGDVGATETSGPVEPRSADKQKGVAPVVVPAASVRDTAGKREPVVITNDSVHVEVKVNMDGLR